MRNKDELSQPLDFESLLQTTCTNCVFSCQSCGTFTAKSIAALSYRENKLITTKATIRYQAEIITAFNQKEVKITSSAATLFENMLSLFMNLMRFENLFDGCFLKPISCVIDGQEYISILGKKLLAYVTSTEKYVTIPLNLSNGEYRHLYFRWLKYEHTFLVPHALFLSSTYVSGTTVDVRMALLLETFEPLSEHLKKLGKIKIGCHKQVHYCPICKSNISKKQIPTLEERLTSVIKYYGKAIFQGESKKQLIRKAVKTRNLVDHSKIKYKGILSGKQCGFYLHKFSLLYRYIVLDLLNAVNGNVNTALEEEVNRLNQAFPSCRL